jgi:hypothetical protein
MSVACKSKTFSPKLGTENVELKLYGFLHIFGCSGGMGGWNG